MVPLKKNVTTGCIKVFALTYANMSKWDNLNAVYFYSHYVPCMYCIVIISYACGAWLNQQCCLQKACTLRFFNIPFCYYAYAYACVMCMWLDKWIVPYCSTDCARLQHLRKESFPDKARHQRTAYRRVAKLNHTSCTVVRVLCDVSIRINNSIITFLFTWLVTLMSCDFYLWQWVMSVHLQFWCSKWLWTAIKNKIKDNIFVFRLVFTWAPSIKTCRRYKQKREGTNCTQWQPFLFV